MQLFRKFQKQCWLVLGLAFLALNANASLKLRKKALNSARSQKRNQLKPIHRKNRNHGVLWLLLSTL